MYQPAEHILQKYARVLINFALWGGSGVKKGEVVYLHLSESAKPFLLPLQQTILQSGAHMMLHYSPEGAARSFFDLATDEQIIWTPKDYMLERVKVVDHFVSIISTDDKFELKGVPPGKIMKQTQAVKFYRDARNEKENRGSLTWTLALYGTEAMAKEAGISLEQYWEQIIKACFLDLDDPIAKWKEVTAEIERLKNILNALQIESVRIEAKDTDLTVKLGPERQWLGGSGRNIPSFELFISPDWRGTEGKIAFDQPLYRYGNIISGIKLEFKEGKVVFASAKENEDLLLEMIKVEGADKIGEFSLTDKRYSRIETFMAETLFDENIGQPNGNTHVALGMAYKDSYVGDPATVSEAEWEEMGFNDSAVHTDIIATSNRQVTATLSDGSKKTIYSDGEFRI